MRAVSALIALALVAACSKSGEGESSGDSANRAGSTAPSAAEVNAQPVVAPTGKAVLTPLAPSASKSLGAVEHTCQFNYQGRTLLAAGAEAASGADVRGVLVANGGEMVLASSPAGAAQVMAKGVTLEGHGYTVTVKSGAAASLSLHGPDGETVFAPGTWSCPK